MKHIFYVHSGITYLVSLAAINHLKLHTSEVIIIIGRSIQIDDQFQCIRLNAKEENIALLPSYGSVEVLKNINVLMRLDRKIGNAAQHSEFTLYLPSEKNYLMQFLQSQRLCLRRNFIEEGLLTYRAGFVKPRPELKGFINRLRHLLRFPFHLYRTEGPKNRNAEKDFTVYVVTETASRVLHSYHTVLLNTSTVQIDQTLPSKAFSSLYVFDAVVEMDLCANDNFLKCLEDFVVEKVPHHSLAIKFHPFQKKVDQYIAIFNKHNIQYEILGNEVIPEMLLAQKRNLSVYGLSSSVLFYGKEMGHEVHSFSSELVKCDKKYFNYISMSIPGSIIDYLKLI